MNAQYNISPVGVTFGSIAVSDGAALFAAGLPIEAAAGHYYWRRPETRPLFVCGYVAEVLEHVLLSRQATGWRAGPNGWIDQTALFVSPA